MVQVSFHHQFKGCKSVHGIIWRASNQFSAHITCLQLSSLQPIRWLQVSFLHQLEGCNSVLCTNERVYIMSLTNEMVANHFSAPIKEFAKQQFCRVSAWLLLEARPLHQASHNQPTLHQQIYRSVKSGRRKKL